MSEYKPTGKLKQYTFTYRMEVKRLATVEAASEADARRKIELGDFDDEHDVDSYGMDDICFQNEDDDVNE